MISLQIHTYLHDGKITIAHCKDNPSVTAKMDISSIHQVSFQCRLYVANSVYRFCVQFMNFAYM